jgi:hypothetical protein
MGTVSEGSKCSLYDSIDGKTSVVVPRNYLIETIRI